MNPKRFKFLFGWRWHTGSKIYYILTAEGERDGVGERDAFGGACNILGGLKTVEGGAR